MRRTDNTRLPAQVVVIDATNDLALIRVKGEKGTPFAIRQALLEKGDRRLTGPTMPPQGLYLNRVWYDGAVGTMMEKD